MISQFALLWEFKVGSTKSLFPDIFEIRFFFFFFNYVNE